MPRQTRDPTYRRIAIEDVSLTQGPETAEDTGPSPGGQRGIPNPWIGRDGPKQDAPGPGRARVGWLRPGGV